MKTFRHKDNDREAYRNNSSKIVISQNHIRSTLIIKHRGGGGLFSRDFLQILKEPEKHQHPTG